MGVLNIAGVVACKALSKTIASGAITGVSDGALVTITSETGTSDTLDTMQFDATELAQVATQHYPIVYLTAASGHTITVTNDYAALSAFQFAFKTGTNLVINDQSVVPVMYIAGLWYGVAAMPQLDGGIVDANTAQTLTNKTLAGSIVLRGVVGSYSGSDQTFDQLMISTADATVTTIFSLALSEGDGAQIKATVYGKRSDESACGVWDVIVGARRASAGNVTIGYSNVAGGHDSGGAPAVTVDADTGSQTVRIRVQGIVAQDWLWQCNVNYSKLITSA